MTANPLQALTTEDLIAMRSLSYRRMAAAHKDSVRREAPQVEAVAWEEAFTRQDQELWLRGVGPYFPREDPRAQ